MASHTKHRGIGNRIAPTRFLLFIAATLVAAVAATPVLGYRFGVMAGFDLGAVVFLAACSPLLRDKSEDMRRRACENDANRLMLLLVTAAVSLVILVAVASELMDASKGPGWALPMILGTLITSWTFSNTIFALHYAHLFYSAAPDRGGDSGGLEFPETPEPNYWDFIYFAFCLGMTFQTSDVTVTTVALRKVVTLHCLLAFVFNLGVLAFTINVLGG